MTPAQLKYETERRQVEPFFFTRDTMKFFGDRMSNYRCRSATIRAMNCEKVVDGRHPIETVEVWELWRRRPVRHGLQDSAYFDKLTFKRRFEIKEADAIAI